MSAHPGQRHYVYAVRGSTSRDSDILIYGGAGAPSGGVLPTGQTMAATQRAIYYRTDGAAGTTTYETVNGGTAWTALAGLAPAATAVTIADAGNYYTAAQVEAALQEIFSGALGGTSSGVRNYTSGFVVTDNQTFFASLDAIDVGMGAALASLTTTAKTLVLAINELDAAADDKGTIATARCVFTANPVDADTLTIGADIYQFVDTAVNTVINNDAHIGVVIGVAAANTLTNLVNAINGAGTAGATVTKADTVTPCLEDGTENVVADAVGTSLRIRSANAVGGTAIAADPNIFLAESITDGADIWDVGNVNLNTLGGNAGGRRSHSLTQVALTTAIIAGDLKLDFPFTVAEFRVNVKTSAGVPRYQNGAVSDAYTLSGNGILCNFGGGGAPNAQNTDILEVEAWSAAS